MLYKVSFRPVFANLHVTLRPKESLTATPGTMVSMDAGIVMKTIISGDIAWAVLRRILGNHPLWINLFHNPTDEPLSIVLCPAFPGDIIRLDLSQSSLCLQPGVHIAHTSQIKMGIHWIGFSSWFAGQGLFGLKLSGRGLIFIAAHGGINQHQTYKKFAVEQGSLLAYSAKIRLKVNFPKGIIGSRVAGYGFVTQMKGGGIIYLQSRSRSGLGRYIKSRRDQSPVNANGYES